MSTIARQSIRVIWTIKHYIFQVRHPVPTEREQIEFEDNFEDYEEELEDTDIAKMDSEDFPPPKLSLYKSDKRFSNLKQDPKSTPLIRDIPVVTREIDTQIYQSKFGKKKIDILCEGTPLQQQWVIKYFINM